MRFLRRLALLALLAGLAAWAKQLLDQQDRGYADSPSPPAGADPAPEPASKAAANGGATKAELYERAQQLGIEGRSRMSKAELERAISQAG